MRYLIYGAWAGVFYFVLYHLHSWSGTQLSAIQLAVIALISPVVFKRYLPVLKDTKFPEVAAFLGSFQGKLSGVGIRTRECSVCKSKSDFPIIFGYDVKKDLEPKRTKVFCRRDGLNEWKQKLEGFRGPILCAEPDADRLSGSFFYEPKDLKAHDYSSTDKATVETLLARMGGSEQTVGWLPKDVIGICQEPPLFKKKDIDPEEITVDELVDRMSRALFQSEQTFKKGEYWITEPRGQGGIYIWDGEV